MHKIAAVLALLACLSHGRPVQNSGCRHVQNFLKLINPVSCSQKIAEADVSYENLDYQGIFQPLRSLVSLLLDVSPAGAFMPFIQRSGFAIDLPRSAEGQVMAPCRCDARLPGGSRPGFSSICMRLDFGQPLQDMDAYVSPTDVEAPVGPQSAPPLEARLAEANSLLSWIEGAGGTVAGIAPQATGDGIGLGLVAAKGARRGDAVLSVPLSLGLSAESCLRSSLGEYLPEFYPELADYSFIALQLLHERGLGEQSELAPWVSYSPSLLPAEGFPDLPLLWGDDAINEIEKATTAGAARRLESIRLDYEWLEENVFSWGPEYFPPAIFNLKAFTEAVAIAFSRSVVAEIAGDLRPVLMPLLDLANHVESNPTAIVKNQKGGGGLFKAGPDCVSLVATGGLSEGESVTITYGGQTSGELFITYGFLQEPVPATAMLRFAIDEEDPNYDDKLDIIDEAGVNEEETFIVSEEACENDQGLAEELLAFLRLKWVILKDSFLLESCLIGKMWAEEKYLFKPISEKNEYAALDDVLAYVRETLDRFASAGCTVGDDLYTASKAAKNSRDYVIASLRYAERRALEAALRAINQKIAEVASLDFYQERRLTSLGLDPISNPEELDALKVKSAGRVFTEKDYDGLRY